MMPFLTLCSTFVIVWIKNSLCLKSLSFMFYIKTNRKIISDNTEGNTLRWFIVLTWLITSCIDCRRMPSLCSGLQESSKNTVLSCLSEARIDSANHGKQIATCQAAAGVKNSFSAVLWPSSG